MICPKCGGRLSVTNTITVGPNRTHAAECKPCDARFAFLTILVGEIEERGDGPHALAKRLRAGEDPRELLE